MASTFTSTSWTAVSTTTTPVKSLDNSTCFGSTPLVFGKSSSTLHGGLALKKMVRQAAAKRPVKFDDRKEALVVHQLEPSEEDPKSLWFSVRLGDVKCVLFRVLSSWNSVLTVFSFNFCLQKKEIKALREEGRMTLAKVNKAGGDLSTLDEANGESIRGLEHGLSVFDHDGLASSSSSDKDFDDAHHIGAPLDRSQRRKNIVHTILSQQQEQRESGIDDPIGLQVTSKACTQWARDRAIEQAIKDFEDALQIWRQDEQCAKLLPSILEKKHNRGLFSRKPTSLLSSMSPSANTIKSMTSAEECKATLDNISRTVASALEELDDLDF